MLKKGLLVLLLINFVFGAKTYAQQADSTVLKTVNDAIQNTSSVSDENKELPVITYSLSPKKYEIADIKVAGLVNSSYEDYVIIGFSNLSVGDRIDIPGSDISNAVKRYWKLGLFSDIKFAATKIEGDKIWLEIQLKDRPRISDIEFSGMKKGERQDIENKIGVIKGSQITPNQIDRAKSIISRYYEGKGFKDAIIKVDLVDDLSKENHAILKIAVNKKQKIKVHDIIFEGNTEVPSASLEKAMKKTRHKNSFKSFIRNFLRSTNYIPENYEEDKSNLVAKYNELGYRDAEITWDTVYSYNEKKIDIKIKIDEGNQYHIRDINWIGNTEFPTEKLSHLLDMQGGDVYNQKKLRQKLTEDEESVGNIFYYNNGYIFYSADPVEVNLENDSVDLEIRIIEGPQATIRKVLINGNDRLYEDVIRRELRTKPGALFSREDLMRSLREVAQMGHFDPENLRPDIQPDPETGTVDIGYDLVSKANDQVEFSAGWGQTGIIGRLSLRFTNFSIKNLFNPGAYKGIIPQGEGQTLVLSAQTNAKYYQSYSVSFMDPWFGGKRPNMLSVGAFYSRQTDVNSNYYSNNAYNYGYGYGYGYGSGYDNSWYDSALDPDKTFETFGLSVAYGKRLRWPDDYFQFQAELSYQLYRMRNWDYFLVRNGNANNLSLNLTLSRNSIDNPVFTRSGSQFSLGLRITPPFSLFDNKDYASMKADEYGFEASGKYKWIEYHKWKFQSKTFTPLISQSLTSKTPVLMTRAEFGMVGYFNKHKKSPFETFYVGGDGMSGYYSNYAIETIGLRGYENGSLGTQASAYSRLGVELRYPLILEPSSTIYVLSFLEGGNAWYDIKDFDPFDMKRSAGVGVRIMLPMIGLMGIDWAYGFDAPNSRSGRNGAEFHFVIGQEF
ncbi:outer membrane protein assembly factor BamA [Dysgonomonas sp. 216]|uniref:BamA/OMP85 family outer membrane protein n=1 Tax=Dysgonomonas sp. 216 TaxID=2302934 RepID=UPI0013D75E99|nr:POTRA domain-containing protein [Dysgonomonas sp. 216]NDW19853.1 outer membrane protein assembly factor BamA [Dysgonomonas sp. 216]